MSEAKQESKSKGFRVPLGLDAEGSLVDPGRATRGEVYCCPGCSSRLVLRKGSKVRHHFAHKASADCSGESALHQTAKLLVADRVANGSPTFILECDTCRRPFNVPFPRDRALTATLEYRLPNGRVLDVALLHNQETQLGVEVFVSSAVDERKAGNLSIPWIELAAEEVVASPDAWRARQHGLQVRSCRVCRRAERIWLAERDRALALYNLTDVSKNYVVSPVYCWKCHKLTPVFEWATRGGMWESGASPPEPRPRTLRKVVTQTAGTRYWANHCAACGVVQGDFYLGRLVGEFHEECRGQAMHALEPQPR